MKIVTLVAENFKRLRAVEITPQGEMVLIAGRNGAGKSSILDAIWAALAGAKHIQAVPIRSGAHKARIRLDLGELVVERRFTQDSTTLTVENAEGARYTSPQGILDALLGALTFNPLAFVHQEPRKQFETLRGIVRLDVDVDELDGLNRRDFERRAEINREAKAARAQANGIAMPDGLPEVPSNTRTLMDRLTQASTINAEIETRRGRREQATREAEGQRRGAKDRRDEAARLREQVERLEQGAADLEAQAAEIEGTLASAPPLPNLVDAEALRRELESAQAINRGIEQRVRRAGLLTEALALERQSQNLTATMEARERAKAEAIARASMPVPGLGFGDGGIVTFYGVPFEQASTAEQLRVSVAIAMAANPRLRVIRIKEGSSLDPDNLALIAEMAREKDYQVWVELIASTDPMAVVIEDGSVVQPGARDVVSF